LRIISGEAHGRKMAAPRGLNTRPATARVRASIFSRITSRMEIAEARVLDIFAGSGALGIEALSRGAAQVAFVDFSRAASATISQNLRNLGLEARSRLFAMDFNRALDDLARAGEGFDLVFVDPPFAADSSAAVLAKLVRLDLLNADGIAVVRQFHRAAELRVAELDCVSLARIGDHRIALYRRVAVAAANRVRAHDQ
jgi:16S rRNA (guanine966-N2)-methyltransferase